MTPSNPHGLVVGQKSVMPVKWWSRMVPITAIGRKWARLENEDRCSLTTLNSDVHFGRRYFLSQQHIQEHERAHALWSKFRSNCPWSPADGVTESDIRDAAMLLRVWIPE